jgi:protein PhnA
MEQLPNCPKCDSEYTYEDGSLLICPECAYEWNEDQKKTQEDELVVKDANGNILKDGDSVTVIKDLKVKGSSSGIKAGTKIKGIRLVEGNDGHNIDCKVTGVGAIKLKQEFVKRA